MLHKIAQTISTLFSPLTFIPLILFWKLDEVHLSSSAFQKTLLILFGFGILPTVGSLILLKRMGRISDWGIDKREQRLQFGLIAYFFMAVTLLILWRVESGEILKLISLLLAGGLIFTLITLFWKISAHTTAATLFSLFLLDQPSLFLLAGVPLAVAVAWSRIYLKRHTLAQVVAGSLLATFIYLVGKMQGFI